MVNGKWSVRPSDSVSQAITCVFVLRCSGVLRLIQDFLGRPQDLVAEEMALTPAFCDQKRAELLLYKLLNQVDSPAARLKVSATMCLVSVAFSNLCRGMRTSMTQLCCWAGLFVNEICNPTALLYDRCLTSSPACCGVHAHQAQSLPSEGLQAK